MFEFDIPIRVHDDAGISDQFQRVLDSPNDRGGENAVDVIDYHPYRIGFVLTQSPSQQIRFVAHFLGNLQYSLSCFRINGMITIGEGARYCGDGDLGYFGEIL